MKKITLFSLVFLSATNAVFAGMTMPSDTDIIKSKKAVSASNSEAMAKAEKAGPLPATVMPQAITPPEFMTSRGVSADAMTMLTGKRKSPADAHKGQNSLWVAVTLSMPVEKLREYAIQAKGAGAGLLLRGVKDHSVRKTAAFLEQNNLAIKGVKWSIDPALFKKFKIDKVPTTVLVDEGAAGSLVNGCAPAPSYLSVVGDISILQSLVIMKQRGHGDLANKAAQRLSFIEGH